MLTKLTIKMRTYYMTLSNNDLIEKVLDDNILIRLIAKEEFLKRDLNNLDIDDETLNKIILRLSIEDMWEIVNKKEQNHFVELVIKKLNDILEYYEKNYPNSYLLKVHEGDKVITLKK